MSNNTCCGTPKDSAESHGKHDDHRQSVRDVYSKVAQANGESVGISESCCGVSDEPDINQLISTRLGYSEDDLSKVPSGADMGLGCGNPRAIASLKAGEVVVDLGAGGGFDCFLASHEVGETGHVIGIDMTPEMLSKARNNADNGKFHNVEFRLGEIEQLPVADETVDVIISNCVINLSPKKAQVFKEALRILKPGGRLAISDVVATVELPEAMRKDPGLIAGCMGNASLVSDLEKMIQEAGFLDVSIQPKDESKAFIRDWAPDHPVTDYVVSATIEARKPAGCCMDIPDHHMCKLTQPSGEFDVAKVSALMNDPKHLCGCCGRTANSANNLCTPLLLR